MIAEVETILQEMTWRLVAEFHPCQIYLFGSHAWGKPNEDSDVDLFVIVPDSDESYMERGLRARGCLSDIRVSKDILVKTQAEVDWASRVYASLESEILECGVKLYG
ncbi:MAG: nucleotidyltransferase domain-containing protein [Janthinobacterium lividum]